MNSRFYFQINKNSFIEKWFKNIAAGSSFKNKVSNERNPFPTMQCFLTVCVKPIKPEPTKIFAL